MARPERSASSDKRNPSTKIDFSTLPSRTARARRSRELSRLMIFILGLESDYRLTERATNSSSFHRLERAPKRLIRFYFRPDGPVIGNIQRLRDAPAINFHAAHENPICMKTQSRSAPGRNSG